MRTIALKEYQPTPTRLSPSELAEIHGAERYVQIGHLSEDGMYLLRPGSTVGTLVFDSVRILIKPKIDLTNLFFLLGFGAGLTEWSSRRFTYEVEPDLFHAIGWAFEAEVERGLRQGLVRGYVGFQEALPTVRGRIDFWTQQRMRQDRPLPLECRYEEYTEDVELNHVLKAAHRRLRMAKGIEPGLSKRLLFRQRSFADVTDVDFAPTRVPEVQFDRLNDYWEPAGRLAELILRQETLRDEAGEVAGAAFMVDMNKLFERFVTRVVRDEAQSAGLDLEDQARRQLTDRVWMKPDLMIRSGSKDVAVGDAKYKELEIQGWPHADLYQLLAYCTALDLPQGLLLYANYQEPHHQVVRRAGIRLELVGIDLSLPPERLEEDARRAARVLIDQANRFMHERGTPMKVSLPL